MSSFTERFSEVNAVLGGLHADQRVAGNYNTAWVAMNNYHRAVVLIDVGPMAAGATLDVLLQEATDAAGAGVQAIAGKAITQLTQAGGDQNDWVMIELRSEELDENNAYAFIRAQVLWNVYKLDPDGDSDASKCLVKIARWQGEAWEPEA